MTRTSQYEYLLAVTPDEAAEEAYSDPEPDEAEDAFAVAAAMVREALRLAAAVALSDAVNGGILLGRMAGLSLAEIGQKNGMTKQAVHKRVLTIAASWPALGEVLTGAAARLDEEIAGRQAVIRTRQKTEKMRQEATRWMNRPN